jgi:hypothetical protein
MDIDFKENHQTVLFVTELLNFDVNLKDPEAGDFRKSSKVSSLFKYKSKYDYSFWDRPEIPLPTEEDNKLLNELHVSQK